MGIEEHQEGKVIRIKILEKRLDARAADSLKDKMMELIEAGNTRIALDISEVQFVDSSGLGAIVSALKLMGGNGDLAIGGVRDTVLSMFKLTSMDRVFRIFRRADEAVAALAQ